jgi:hypothetical protein
MLRLSLCTLLFTGATLIAPAAGATASAELYTSAAYHYGRFEARVRFAAGDGVISSFFLWKDGSEQSGTFWNELDYEKLGADCHVQTNALFGNPVGDHGQQASLSVDPCGGFHVYSYEWLPDSITWFVDGMQIRKETGDVASAYADNAPNGMQLHFNIWPGDASFGGNFNPSILPVHQFIDWVQYSSYDNGTFKLAWREDFDGASVPSGWSTGNWASPKSLSTHDPRNVNFVGGYAVLSLTADDATGPAGAMPGDDAGMGGSGTAAGGSGAGGSAAGGMSSAAGGTANGGSPGLGGSSTTGGAPALGGSSTAGGSTATGGSTASGGASATGGVPAAGGAGGTASSSGGTGAVSTGGSAGDAGGGAQAAGSPSAGTTAGSDATGAAGSGAGNAGAGSDGDSGCGCRLVGPERSSPRGFLIALTLGAVSFTRRRRRRA